MENYLECPITHMIMAEPVVASDGHIYEKGAIQRWLSSNRQSPVTRELLDGRLFPIVHYRTMITDYLEKNPDQKVNQYIPVKISREYNDIQKFFQTI
jgi:hypothetical protein